MRPFLLTIGFVVLVVGAVAVDALTDNAVLAWAIVVVPVAMVVLRNLVFAARRRRGLAASDTVAGVGKSTDNYNLDGRSLVERMRRPLFWAIMLPSSALCVLLPWLAAPHGAWLVTAACCLVLLWIVASITVTMLPVSAGALDAFATRQELQRAPDTTGPTPWLAGTSLHRIGAAQHTTQSFIGRRAGLAFTLFRLSFERRSEVGTNVVQLTTIAIDTRIPDFPEFAIDSRELFDFRDFLGPEAFEELSLEGSFGRRFRVLVERADSNEKRLLALSLVAPDFMAVFEDYFAESSLVSQGGKFVLVTRRDLFARAAASGEDDSEFDRLLDGLTRVLRMVDRQVRIRTAVRGIDDRLASLGITPSGATLAS